MTRGCCAAIALAAALLATPTAAGSSPRYHTSAIDAAVARAAVVSGLPEDVIRAVMAAESGGDPGAVSPAGALGLMQLMPSTWRMLRARLRLGPDPFDVEDNVLAGAMYLRELRDRFGAPGFLAAYNAGPTRYAQHLAGRPLPRETRAYLVMLARQVGDAAGPGASDWRASPLFPGAAADTLQPAGL